jgi:hypothetical protein
LALRYSGDDRLLDRLHRVEYTGPEATEIPVPEVEIGWWLDPALWGKGLALEGELALRDEAFRRVGLDRIIGRYQPDNLASAPSWTGSECASNAKPSADTVRSFASMRFIVTSGSLTAIIIRGDNDFPTELGCERSIMN